MTNGDNDFKIFSDNIHTFDVSNEMANQMINRILNCKEVMEAKSNHLKYDDNSRKTFSDEEVKIYDKAYIDGYNAGYRQCLLSRWKYNNKRPGTDFKFGGF